MFRKMRRERQQLSREECIEILKSEKRGVLSVLGDDGYPYGAPLNHFYCEEDGCLYFHSGRGGHRADAIARSPKASYCVFTPGEKTGDHWWLTVRSVIVFGKVLPVTDAEKAAEICRRLSLKFTQDLEYIEREIRESGPGVFCFALHPEQITGKTVEER